MNWEDLRFFLAIAKAGTLSGAARALDVDQATVSRRLASLEAALQVRLVDRLPRESRLTAIGQEVLAQVTDIEADVFALRRRVLTSRLEARTKVTVTAPPILARHVLAPHIYALSQRLPQVQLSILSESHFVSLSQLEADIALRLSPGLKDTDIVKSIGRMDFALYAAASYSALNAPSNWEFIGYPERQNDFEHKRWLYETIGTRRVVCEVPDLSHQYEAACTGIGVAGLPRFLGDAAPRLVRLATDQRMLSLDIWLAIHGDRRDDGLIRQTSASLIDLVRACGLSR